MLSIIVRSENKNLPPVKLKAVAPGQTLLQILLSNDIAVRHDCGGVCYCTTCNIYIEKGAEFIEEPTKRETDFLMKVADRKPNSRLACQCLLLDGRGKIELCLPVAE